MSDLFGVEGIALLDLAAPYAARVGSLRRIMDGLDFEIDHVAGMLRGRLAAQPGYVAVQHIPGIGPTLAAVLVAEIGDIGRFARPEQLTCWAGLTPAHHESDAHVHRGRITKQGSRLVRWAVVESVQILPNTTMVGQFRDRVAARRGHNIGVVAAGRRQLEYVFYALRDHHVRTDPRTRHEPRSPRTGRRGSCRSRPPHPCGAGVVVPLIDPDRPPSTANPIMPPACRGEGMTAGPHDAACHRRGTPGHDERHVHTRLKPHRSSADSPTPLFKACAERRRRQGPSAAIAVGLRPSIDPDALPRRVPSPSEEAEQRSQAPLDRPRSFRDDLRFLTPGEWRRIRDSNS
jgi:hypothetical protein